MARDRGFRVGGDAKRFTTERMRPAFEKVGAPAPPPPEFWPVHNHIRIAPGVRRMKRVEAARRYDIPVELGFAITNPANWSTFWPGYVRLVEGSRWAASGDTARLVTR